MSFITPSIITLQVVGENTNEFDAITGASNGKLTLSDHSRSPLSIDYDLIEKSFRMADGTARKQIIAKKRTFSCSWEMLPTIRAHVADSNADALDVKRFFELNSPKTMNMSLYHKRNSDSTSTYKEDILVYFTSFNYDIVKRYRDFDYWNVTIEIEEV